MNRALLLAVIFACSADGRAQAQGVDATKMNMARDLYEKSLRAQNGNFSGLKPMTDAERLGQELDRRMEKCAGQVRAANPGADMQADALCKDATARAYKKDIAGDIGAYKNARIRIIAETLSANDILAATFALNSGQNFSAMSDPGLAAKESVERERFAALDDRWVSKAVRAADGLVAQSLRENNLAVPSSITHPVTP